MTHQGTQSTLGVCITAHHHLFLSHKRIHHSAWPLFSRTRWYRSSENLWPIYLLFRRYWFTPLAELHTGSRAAPAPCHVLQLLTNFHFSLILKLSCFLYHLWFSNLFFASFLLNLICFNSKEHSHTFLPFLLFWVLQIKLAPAKHVFYHWTAFQVHTHTLITVRCVDIFSVGFVETQKYSPISFLNSTALVFLFKYLNNIEFISVLWFKIRQTSYYHMEWSSR